VPPVAASELVLPPLPEVWPPPADTPPRLVELVEVVPPDCALVLALVDAGLPPVEVALLPPLWLVPPPEVGWFVALLEVPPDVRVLLEVLEVPPDGRASLELSPPREVLVPPCAVLVPPPLDVVPL
jgi:hypothetical protein